MAGTFLRSATGLLREFGVVDAIWINLGLVGIFFSLTFIASTAPLTGGDPLFGGLMSLVFMFFVALAFSIVSIIIPRTAADYVFVSRYLSPAFGFVGNAGYFVATVPLFMGITIVTLESFGLSALFAYLGLATSNASLTSLASTLLTPQYEFLAGAVLTIVAGVLPIFGYKLFKVLSNIILPLILVAVAVMFVVLAVTPTSVALSRLTSFSGNPQLLQSISSFGASHNSPPPALYSFSNILALNAVYVVGFSYIISAIYIAGEVRQIRRNMPLAIIGTLLITFVIFYGSTALSYKTFGYQFLSNLYTMSILYSQSPFPVVPYLDFLTAAISNNLLIGSFIIIMATIQLFWYQTNAVFIGSRLLLSYSLDRILPAFLGDVNERFRAPIKGMVTCLVLGLIAGLVFVLPTTAAVAFLMSSAAVAIILLFPITVVGITLIVYRIRKSKEFEASPLKNSALGGALYWLSAILTIVYSLVVFYEYVTVPALFGFAGAFGLELIFVPIAVLFAIYFVSRFVNQKRGVNFAQIFKEIPPE
jgi:amino acid transporter